MSRIRKFNIGDSVLLVSDLYQGHASHTATIYDVIEHERSNFYVPKKSPTSNRRMLKRLQYKVVCSCGTKVNPYANHLLHPTKYWNSH